MNKTPKRSFVGNHKSLMIACVSPSSSNIEESLNWLRYVNHAKNIQNNDVVNVDANSPIPIKFASRDNNSYQQHTHREIVESSSSRTKFSSAGNKEER